jgi:hypothetical protein
VLRIPVNLNGQWDTGRIESTLVSARTSNRFGIPQKAHLHLMVTARARTFFCL